MRSIIDTDVAILLRDGNEAIERQIGELALHPMISVLSRIELEAGVYRDAQAASTSRVRLDLILSQFEVLPLTPVEAAIYGRIVERCGYSRRRIIDRLIAATAIAIDATLITINGADFRNIPDLKLQVWSSRG